VSRTMARTAAASGGDSGEGARPSAPAPWRPAQRLKNDLIHGLARGAMWLVGRLPLRLAMAVGAAVGLLGWLVAGGERQKAVRGLGTAFPDRGRRWHRRTARRCFAALGRAAAEVCHLFRLGDSARSWANRYVAFPDEGVLEAALGEGRGVVWVTGHVGNWELLAAGLGARGHDLRPFAKESYDSRLTALIDAWRRAVGVRTIWRRRGDVEAAVAETLAGGGIIGVLMDQDTRVRGAFVPFFGRDAWTPTGAAELALSTGAPLVVGFVHRRPGGGHEIRAERVALGSPGSDAVVELTAELTARIEATIRERPEEWVWMHERWRTRPRDVEAR